MIKISRTTIVPIVIGACALTVAGGGATALAHGQRGQVAQSASSGVHPATNVTGQGIDQVVVAYDGPNSTVGSAPTPAPLPGMTVQITVPSGFTALLIARFSAESACYGGDAGQPEWCTATIKANGVEMSPQTGSDFAFDSTDNGAESNASWESHAMERVRRVPAGTYTVRVFGLTTLFGTSQPTFWTGERVLTVESSLTPAT
ncbi:MAG: hypothetical protein JO246_14485 [Frankiaceae bacterium]|nr:hypothetical protein [Frankiaceae bacterium]MBV9871854.1 hypothetical protein [Frankiaceae bacterium]